MKTSVKVVACMVFLITLLAVSCGSSQTTENERLHIKHELEGVWKVTEFTITFFETRTITDPQPWFFIFTNKHIAVVGDTSERPSSELPQQPTYTQPAAAYEAFAASFSTYEVEGTTITTHLLISKDPTEKPGSSLTVEYRIEGDNLFITTEIDPDVPVGPAIIKLKRIE